jgi:hypothetical protein
VLDFQTRYKLARRKVTAVVVAVLDRLAVPARVALVVVEPDRQLELERTAPQTLVAVLAAVTSQRRCSLHRVGPASLSFAP